MPIRLNDTLSENNQFQSEARDFLQKIIDEIQYNPPPPLLEVPIDEVSTEIRNYYEKYYIPLDTRGYIPQESDQKGLLVSSYEYRILDFCINPRSETRIFIIHGHTGVGKSSLIRRVIYYLYPQFSELKKSFKPIYIQVKEDLVEDEEGKPISTNKILKKLEKKVCENTYSIIRDYLIRDGISILKEMNDRGIYSGQFRKSVIEKAQSQDIEDWVHTYFSDSTQRYDFELEVLSLLIRKGHVKVIVTIDDVDKHSKRIHASIFSASDSLASRGINVIACMRTSTYHASAVAILQVQDNVMEITLGPDLIEQLMRRRVELIQTEVKLRPEMPFRIKDYESVSGKDVVDSFCALILRSPCIKALVHLSNTNIKSIFLKLSLMARSEAFSDSFVVRQLLERDIIGQNQKQPSKIWVFYHLLLGIKAGTYSRDAPGAIKANLVNLFDSNSFETNPWKHFIRLNILTYLYKIWIHLRDDNHYISCAALQEKFRLTFGNLISPAIFEDALMTLILSELVFMGSCRRYKDEDDLLENVYSDTIMISPSGRFYLENLFHKVEYLYFMKDDVLWLENRLPQYMKPASREYSRPVKFSGVLQALQLLSQAEWKGLSVLRAYWEGRNEDSLQRYRDDFSPYGLAPDSSIAFTEVLLRSYSMYMEEILGNNFERSRPQNIIEEIRSLGQENEGIKKVYLQA